MSSPTRRTTAPESCRAGGGAIIPFNQRVGVRGDLRILSTSGKWVRDDGVSTTGSGAGVAGTITGYVNIVQGLNFQAGFKGQSLNAGNTVPSFAPVQLVPAASATATEF